MKHLIKTILVVVLINIMAFSAAGLVYLQSQENNPSNAYNGFAFVWPLIILGISVLFVLVVTFATALKNTSSKSVSSNSQRYKNIAISIAAGFIPLLLLYFATLSEDRFALKLVAVAGLILCLVSVIFNLVRSPTNIPKR